MKQALKPSALLVSALLIAAGSRPADAQPIYVRLLGTAGPSLNPNQAEAGLLVVAGPEVLLFDCGHGIPNRLAQVGRTAVRKVFLTHGESPSQPSGTADLTTDASNAFATNAHIRRDLVEHLPAGGIEFQTTEITSEGVVYQNNGVTVTRGRTFWCAKCF